MSATFFGFLAIGLIITWLGTVFFIWWSSDTSGFQGAAVRNIKISCANIIAAACFLILAAIIRLAS